MPRPKNWPNAFCKSFLVFLTACRTPQSSPSPLPSSQNVGISLEKEVCHESIIQESESITKIFIAYARPRTGWLRIKATYPYKEIRTEGSAWYWKDHGVWVTCAHLIPQDDPNSLEIELWDVGGKCRTLSLPWRDSVLDVAFLRDTQEVGFIGSEGPPEEGDWVFTMGAPMGLSFSFQEGYFVAERQIKGQVYHQFSFWAVGGSSGSPILNRRGELIGMIAEVAASGSSDFGVALGLPIPKIAEAYKRYLTFASHDSTRAD